MTEPPGGPPDSTPPHLVIAHPESGTVVPTFNGDATLRFDEVVDELSLGGSGHGATRVILSPVAGDVQVSWHRASIHVKPAEGWKKGRIYHLQVLPGLSDLRHNVMKQGAMVIFSTGPAVPRAALTGTALQWVEQRVLAQAVIRAAPLPDTVAYVTVADSGGGFTLSNIPRGRYRVYAIQDQNGDRRLDPREAYDGAIVTVDSTASVVLFTFQHDTIAPKLHAADPADSVTVRLTFSQPLDPKHPLDTAAVRIFALPDSTPVRVRAVLTGALHDSLQARERAIADSLRRAKDTTAHAAPSRAGARAAPPPAAAPIKRDTTAAKVDTARIRQLLRQRPIPTDRWVVRTLQPLKPGAKYLVRTHAVNITGTAADPQTVFVVPIPKAAPDSGRAKPAKRP